ncbi:MAG: Hsp33 family molecular chaperone HslO [Fibrobacteraceae bacterium]|nr:Hsp33 family molecular chaperone HslO [Fibrobacteraceae bacterium]
MSKDRIIRATGKTAPFRLVLVDLTQTMNEIGKKHGALSYSLKLMAETTIASIFLSSSLKFRGTVSVKATFAGELTSIQADTTPYISRNDFDKASSGQVASESSYLVRASIPHQELERIKGDEPAAVPQTFEVVKLDDHGKRVHESIVEATSPFMGRNLASYLLQSEQVKSAVGIEAQFNQEDPSKLDYAAGFYVEAFGDITEKDITILEQVVLNLPAFKDMYKTESGDIVDELKYQFEGPYDIDVVLELGAKPYCPCSKERTLSSLSSLPLQDLQEMVQEGKDLEMICDFCRSKYNVTIEDIKTLIKEREK